MRKHVLTLAAAAAVVSLPSLALAQASTATGVAAGAATGAVVGGPIGAVVGGIAGGVVGATAENPPPPAVRTYVVQEQRPSVVYEGPVVVGTTLPQTVELYPVPKYDAYEYTVINHKRVIVDPYTRKVVEVVQ